MNVRRQIFFALAVILVARSGGAVAAEAPGLVAERPKDGPHIKTDRGYMVPYTQKIPGTDVAFEMVPIPGGVFTMGSAADEAGRREDEGPQFRVRVEPFWMGRHEVTWAEYEQFIKMYGLAKQYLKNDRDAAGADAVTFPTPIYDVPSTRPHGLEVQPRHPASSMTQYGAMQYTKWMSKLTGDFYRLPTEAEWEYAARAGTQTAYFFGNDPAMLVEYAWFYPLSEEVYHEVGLKRPNPWGLHDIYGNVAEWTIDQFQADWYERFAGRIVDSSQITNFPTRVEPCVLRGGSYDDDPENCRSAARIPSRQEDWQITDPDLPRSPWWFAAPGGYAVGVGFRIIRPLNPEVNNEPRFWDPDIASVKEDAQQRLQEGRGARAIVTPDLPAQIKRMKKNDR